MVEFVFVVPLLVMLVFGIVFFGLALNIKQDLTRAASEGARVGAVALPNQDRNLIALNATDDAVNGFLGGGCGSIVEQTAGFTRSVNTSNDLECQVSGPSSTLCDNGQGQCVRVTIVYTGNLTGNWIPLASMATPDKLVASSVVRVNEVNP